MNKYYLTTFVYLLSFQLSAQVFTGYRLQQIQNTVSIEFTIKSGNTCDGIDILHSSDSIFYTLIGNISGICGSASTDVPYSFIDEAPLINAVNYYQLDLKELGFSSTLEIHVYDQKKNILIFPNPTSFSFNIFYPYELGHSAELALYNINGKLIRELQNINTNPILINSDGLTEGVYFVRLAVGDAILIDKLILCR